VIRCDRGGKVLQKIGPLDYWRIAVAPPADLVFGARVSNEIRAWSVDTGEQVFFWPSQGQCENIAIAATPNGQTACLTTRLADGSRQLQIIDVGSEILTAQLPVRSANNLDISPDGRWLVFDSNNDLQLYDLQKHALVGIWQGHQGAIRSLQFSQDGRRVGSVSADRTLKVWSVPSGELEYSVIAHRTGIVDLAFSPDGRRIATAGKDRMLRIWDGQKLEPLWECPVAEGHISDLCFSADGQRLLCLCNDQQVLILDGSPAQDQP
jgi:WD40 repeat protein